MNQFNITIEGAEEGAFQQSGSDTVLRAALRAGIGFPYECNSGGCGSCKFDVVSGEVDNLWPEAPAITERDRRKGRLLACQCVAKTDLTIKVRPQAEAKPVILPRRMQAKLLAVHDVTHDIREFRFGTAETANFLPGQYAMFAIPGVSTPRAYSMSNIIGATPSNEWHVQVRRVPNGKATAELFDRLHPGDGVEIDGPYGMAYLRPEVARDVVCVAGGSGLAPMVSIARGASKSGLLRTQHLHFFYGARTPRDVCGDAFLKELPEFGDRIHFHPVVSMPGEGADAWAGETGFVHELVKRKMGERMTECEFYFAGPPPMTNALQEMLMLEFKVPFGQIHFDRFF